MNFFKRILIVLLVIFVIIQFIRPAKNVHAGAQPNHVMKNFPASPEVRSIMEKACFDCHSNNTTYPWYSYIQPFAWWLNDHIEEGKKEVNYDEFLSYTPKKQHKKFEETAELVKEGEMPLKSYTWIHRDAKLTDAERQAIVNWATRSAATISYPAE